VTTTIEPSAAGLTLDDVIATEDYTIGAISILDRTGDTRVMWDSRNKEEVKAAEKQFDSLRKSGYLAYKAVGKEGTQGEQIREFDKKAERIIFVKPNVGG
jgi:hypothetical protein